MPRFGSYSPFSSRTLPLSSAFSVTDHFSWITDHLSIVTDQPVALTDHESIATDHSHAKNQRIRVKMVS
jgi:hypothetical protein